MHHLSLPQAHRVAEVAGPGQRVLAVTPAPFSFTNSVHFYLDAAGELLGTPLVASGFVAGRQQANPVDVQAWPRELAHLLVRIHAIRPTVRQRRDLYAGNERGLYFCPARGRRSWPGIHCRSRYSTRFASSGRRLPTPTPCFYTWTTGPATCCASREMGDVGATDDRAATDYYEFVAGAIRRARAGR